MFDATLILDSPFQVEARNARLSQRTEAWVVTGEGELLRCVWEFVTYRARRFSHRIPDGILNRMGNAISRLRVFGLLLAFCSTLHADQLTPPQPLSTVPSSPRSNQSIRVIYPVEYCGDIFSTIPSDSLIERAGSVIRITAEHRISFCFPGQPFPLTFSWDVGPYPAGTYQIELYGYRETTPSLPYIKGTGSVVIAGTSAPAPSVISVFGDWTGRLVLIVALLAAGLALGRASFRR